MRTLPVVFGAALLAGMISQSHARTQIPDVDADEKYSLAEVRAVFPHVSDEAFEDADVDGDGYLSPEELKVNQVSGDLPS